MIHDVTSQQRKIQLEKVREMNQSKKELEINNLKLKLDVEKESKEIRKQDKMERKII